MSSILVPDDFLKGIRFEWEQGSIFRESYTGLLPAQDGVTFPHVNRSGSPAREGEGFCLIQPNGRGFPVQPTNHRPPMTLCVRCLFIFTDQCLSRELLVCKQAPFFKECLELQTEVCRASEAS